MFLLHRPSEAEIRSFISAQQHTDFSYSPLELTRSSPPAGYNVDHNRVQLGTGAQCFTAACAAIKRWKMFDLGWVKLCFDDTPIEAGATVAIVVRHLGFWSMNACRIVYVIEEQDKYGFAYGTLTEHAEIGEERFMVEWDRESDAVWYDLLACSKPGLMAMFGYPIARKFQKKFAAGSKDAMKRAVESL
jgi:uncharacterized protein (UPF0548 family)